MFYCYKHCSCIISISTSIISIISVIINISVIVGVVIVCCAVVVIAVVVSALVVRTVLLVLVVGPSSCFLVVLGWWFPVFVFGGYLCVW